MLNFEKLEVWKRGCRLSVEIYRVLANVHDYGLVDQMTRAAVSIPSNIAEGAERKTDKEYINFLHITKGSVAELRTQLYIASKLEMIPREKKTKKSAAFCERSKVSPLAGLGKCCR